MTATTFAEPRALCPEHRIPHCSPQLNGCVLPMELITYGRLYAAAVHADLIERLAQTTAALNLALTHGPAPTSCTRAIADAERALAEHTPHH